MKNMQLSKWMKEKKLSVNAMSKQCGISRQTINNVLSRNIDITLKTAMAIYRFTDKQVTLEELEREIKE